MQNAASHPTIEFTISAKDPWGNGRETVRVSVDIDGCILTYDPVARHFGRGASYSPATQRAIRAKAARKGWCFGR